MPHVASEAERFESPGLFCPYTPSELKRLSRMSMTELANDQKYTTAMFFASKKYFNPDFVDMSKTTRLEVLYNGRYVIGRVVLKEPSNAVSISTILQIAVINLKRCIKWDLKVESQSGIKMWNLKVQHHQSEVWSKSRVAYKPEYYVNIWDPWMMDSFKTTSSVLGKRSIPADLINMIQEFTHTKDQHTD